MVLVTELLMLIVAVLLVRFVQSYFRFRRMELAIPGPPTLPLLGNALDFVGVTQSTMLQTILRLVGGRRELCRLSILNHLLVFVSCAEDIDQLFVRRKEFNDKSHLFYDMMENPRSVVHLGGAEWKQRRKSLEPGFNKKVLDRFVEVFAEEARLLVRRMPAGQPVDVRQPLRRAMARNFLRVSVSEDVSSDVSPLEEDVLMFLDYQDAFLHSAYQRSWNPLLWSDRVFQMTPFARRMSAVRQRLDAFVMKSVLAKREEKRTREECLDSDRKTIAEILVDLFDSAEIRETDILHEVKVFFAGSVETLASALSWSLKVLSMYPEVQERVYSEVVAVIGDRYVAAEDLAEFKYLHCVIKEVLRMFPPVPFVARQCHAAAKLCGHDVPANSTVVLNIHGLHYDPKHWPEPHRFDPDRFLPENSKGRHLCAFIPFSVGSRNCIGGKYAMMVLTTFLATTVGAFRVLPVDDHKDLQSLADGTAYTITTRLARGTWVEFQPRNSAAE